jgi:HK97 gp10 family phage protein
MAKPVVTVRFNRFPQTALALKAAVQQLVEKATLDIAADAANNAPYDTGALQESISTQIEGTFTGAEGLVYTNQEYAAYQEFGTIRHGPHPYMRPAAMKERLQLIALGQTLGKSVEKAAKGG